MIDYAKIAYQHCQHHARFKRFVESLPRRYVCPFCSGAGGHREIIDLEIGGPWFDCGLCEGLGITAPKLWSFGMRTLREEKAKKRLKRSDDIQERGK